MIDVAAAAAAAGAATAGALPAILRLNDPSRPLAAVRPSLLAYCALSRTGRLSRGTAASLCAQPPPRRCYRRSSEGAAPRELIYSC